MTLAGWPIMLGAVVIDSTNKTIRVVENAVTVDVNIAEGTYYLSGDGTGTDLLEAFRAAVQSHTGANTYTIAIAYDPNDANKSATITLTRATGANSLSIQWGATQTTFDETLLGFTGTSTLSGSTLVNTLSPRSIWVADEVMRALEPVKQRTVSVVRANSGIVRGVARTDTFDVRTLSIVMAEERRTNSSANSADPNAAFDRFLDYVGDGKQVRLYLADMSAGTVAAPGTQQLASGGAGWYFSQETCEEFAPRRLEEGIALYDFDVVLMGHV